MSWFILCLDTPCVLANVSFSKNVLTPLLLFTTGWPREFGTIIWYALTLPNINRFSRLFHYQNRDKICCNTIAKDPTTPQVCRLWNDKCLKTIENRTTSVTTHFKKLTAGNNVFIVSVIVQSITVILQFLQYIKCSVCSPCCWTTHSSRRRHWSRHWSVASPAWVRRPAARRIHWTFDVETAECDSYFRQ